MAQNLSLDVLREEFDRLDEFSKRVTKAREAIGLGYSSVIYCITVGKSWRENWSEMAKNLEPGIAAAFDEFEAARKEFTSEMRVVHNNLYNLFFLHGTNLGEVMHVDNLPELARVQAARMVPESSHWILGCINWKKAARERAKTMRYFPWDGQVYYY